MLKTRVIPCLLLNDQALVKTTRFQSPRYIGDPLNTLRIFNELNVDEIILLDIGATKSKKEPQYELLQKLSEECFMPFAYGGGVSSVKQAKKLIHIGMEKVILNASAHLRPELISEIAGELGSQAVVVSIDVKKNFFGKYQVVTQGVDLNTKKDPVDWAVEAQQRGAGEIMLTSIDREGTWSGFDTDLVQKVTRSVDLPVIAHGGAGSIQDISEVIKLGGASAVALGSMVVYQGNDLGVLVNFPDHKALEKALNGT